MKKRQSRRSVIGRGVLLEERIANSEIRKTPDRAVGNWKV